MSICIVSCYYFWFSQLMLCLNVHFCCTNTWSSPNGILQVCISFLWVVLWSYFPLPEFAWVYLQVIMRIQVLEFWNFIVSTTWNFSILFADCDPIIPCFFSFWLINDISITFNWAFRFSWSFLFSSLRILTCSSSNSNCPVTLGFLVDLFHLIC